MSRKSRIAATILTAALVALSICAVPSAMAKPSAHAFRFNVIKRTSDSTYLRAVQNPKGDTTKPTITSPNSGQFAVGASTTISWRTSAADSSCYYLVSLRNTANGASTGLTSKVLAHKGVTSYSAPWKVTQAVGTYSLWVYYYSSQGKVIGSDVSDGSLRQGQRHYPGRNRVGWQGQFCGHRGA